jgi:hypothetical protein
MVFNISDTLLVLWCLLHVYLAARHCTFSSEFMFSFVWGSQTVQQYSNLGVTISSDLKWNTHIQQTAAKANKSLCFIRRNLKVQSQTIKERAYQTLIRPKLEYCCTVIGFLLVVIFMMLHLSGWNDMSQSCSHFMAASRSSWSLRQSLCDLICR